jgi:hypothetical protein
MRRCLVIWLAAACGGGAAPALFSGSTMTNAPPSDGTACGDLAVEYHAAFFDALACSGSDKCTEWRPLTVGAVANGGNTADARLTGLCFTAGVGYVTPQRTASLDAIIARYEAAGCTVGYCPGPAGLGATACEQNKVGKFTCGGW